MAKKHADEEKTPVDIDVNRTDAEREKAKADKDAADKNNELNLAGSFETEAQKAAREEREKRAAEGGDERMSPVNPRKPLSKEPVYAAGVGPNLGITGDLGVPTPTDPRVPPENVTVPGVAPGGKSTDGTSSEPVPGQQTAQAGTQASPAPIPTPAQVGLPDPHLRAGLDPLPEEEPTPSTVPIPPPGPRRVA